MQYYGVDWIGTVLGLASIYYLGQQRRVGFLLRIMASVCWVLFGVMVGTPAGVLANVAVIILSFKGIREWNKRLPSDRKTFTTNPPHEVMESSTRSWTRER